MKQSLSPRELGQAIGVSESSLKRWADEGRIKFARTTGGHRRIVLTEAVRFIRQAGMPVLRPHLLGLADLEDLPKEQLSADAADRINRPFHDALLYGNAERARGLLLSLYLSGSSVASLCDGPIVESMHQIGELWAHDDTGVFIEHRATDICIQALSQLRSLLPRPDDLAPVALGGAIASDPYVIPSMMAATVVAAEGWRSMNLGPNTPAEALLSAAEQARPGLVWITVSVQRPVDELVKTTRGVVDRLTELGASVMVGGRAWPAQANLRRPDVFVANTMSELAAFARGALATQPPRAGSVPAAQKATD